MKILFHSADPADKRFFQEMADLVGLTLKSVPTHGALCSELLIDKDVLIVIDASQESMYRDFEKNLTEKVGLFNDIVNPNRIFYISDKHIYETPYLFNSDIFGNYVYRAYDLANKDLFSRVLKSASVDDVFLLDRFFNDSAKLQNLVVTSSLQKVTIVDSLKAQLVKIGFKTRIAATISTAIDELIMNAIFDAPIDETGKRIYSQTPRNSNIELKERNSVEVKLAYNGEFLGVSVSDKHGSLEKKKILSQHLGKTYTENKYDTRSLNIGAGLGLSNVFKNSGGMIFCCESGSRTTVHIFFKKTDSFKEFKDGFRFLSTFTYFPNS